MKYHELQKIITDYDNQGRYELVHPVRINASEYLAARQELIAVDDFYDVNCHIKDNIEVRDWIKVVNKGAVFPEKDRVPNHVRILYDHQYHQIVGGLNIRPVINRALRMCGGNVGYFIIPSRRGEGLGVFQLALAVDQLYKFQINHVYVTAHEHNMPSTKTILHFTDHVYNSQPTTRVGRIGFENTYRIEID